MQTASRFYNQFLTSLGVDSTTLTAIDKEKNTRANYFSLLNKTTQMFTYSGLPYTLPSLALERILQLTGAAVIVNVPSSYRPLGFGPSFACLTVKQEDGPNLYAFPLNLADAPDPYQEPYKAIVTSAGFTPTISETYEINRECVVIRNDTYMRGLSWLHSKYAALLTEAEVSLKSTLVTLRDHMTFMARTKAQKDAIEEYLTDLSAGKYGAILSSDLGSPLQAIAHDGRSNAVELAVNGVQAIRSAWYNEIGLNPSFSLKREYTSAQEIDTQTDLLLPAVDDMFECRKRGVDDINAMFGTSITVSKSSAWAVKEEEIQNTLEAEKAQADMSELKEGDDNVDNGQSGESAE